MQSEPASLSRSATEAVIDGTIALEAARAATCSRCVRNFLRNDASVPHCQLLQPAQAALALLQWATSAPPALRGPQTLPLAVEESLVQALAAGPPSASAVLWA